MCVGAPVPTGWCVPCGIGLPDRPCRTPLAWGSLLAMSCLGEWGTAGRAGRILVNKGVERRRTGVSQHHPSHEKAALTPLRLPSAAQTAAFHSKNRLEPPLHTPFGRPDFINFRYYFRVRRS